VALGDTTLIANTTGTYNTALGAGTLESNTTGSNNVAIGPYALLQNTTASNNVAIGNGALADITTGSNDIALGHNAGYFITDGSTANVASSNSIYLGSSTKAHADGDMNEIVIGNSTTGLGSNTTVIGNASTTAAQIYGTLTATGTIQAISGGFEFPDGTIQTTAATGTSTALVAMAFSTSAPLLTTTSAAAVSTLAGQPLTSGALDGAGRAARFNYPSGIAADNAGNLFLADTNNNTIRKIVASTGVVTTLAGLAGSPGCTDGTGSAARFNNPSGVAVDATGNVYVADTLNHTIRRVTPAGVVNTFAGWPGASGSADGPGINARFQGPQGVAIDASGNLYVADTNNHTVRKMVLSTGIVSTIAGLAGTSGTSDGLGGLVRFNFPSGIAVDGVGDLFVADTENHTIRKILSSGLVSTLAGLPGARGATDGTGSAAGFNSPSALAVDLAGNIYVADTDNHTIRQVVSSTGAVTTLAGLAGTSGSADGSGTAARFFGLAGIAVDSNSNLYVADTNNHTVRLAVLPLSQ
jgi:sugar lactone lactonase YvrE